MYRAMQHPLHFPHQLSSPYYCLQCVFLRLLIAEYYSAPSPNIQRIIYCYIYSLIKTILFFQTNCYLFPRAYFLWKFKKSHHPNPNGAHFLADMQV